MQIDQHTHRYCPLELKSEGPSQIVLYTPNSPTSLTLFNTGYVHAWYDYFISAHPNLYCV